MLRKHNPMPPSQPSSGGMASAPQGPLLAAAVRHVVSRLTDLLAALDPRFTTTEVEAALQRDRGTVVLEHMLTHNTPRCLYLFVSSQLDAASSSRGAPPDTERSAGEAAAAGLGTAAASVPASVHLVDMILFSPRVVSLHGVSRVLYVYRSGSGTIDRGTAPPAGGSRIAAGSDAGGGSPGTPALGDRTSARPSGRHGTNQTGSAVGPSLKEIDLATDFHVGSCVGEPLQHFVALERELVAPLVQNIVMLGTRGGRARLSAGRPVVGVGGGASFETTTSTVPGGSRAASNTSPTEGSNGQVPDGDGGKGGVTTTAVTSTLSEAGAAGGVVEANGAGRVSDFVVALLRAVESMETLSRNAEMRDNAIAVQHATSLLQGVLMSPNGINKAAADARLSGPMCSLCTRWTDIINFSCTRDNIVTHAPDGTPLSFAGAVPVVVAAAPHPFAGAVSSSPEHNGGTTGNVNPNPNPNASTSGNAAAPSPNVGDDPRKKVGQRSVAQISDALGPAVELAGWREFAMNTRGILDSCRHQDVVNLLRIVAVARPDVAAAMTAAIKRLELASSEAVDVIKYLEVVERYYEPFYTEPPRSAVSSVMGLVENIHCLHKILAFYHTSDHIARLLLYATNQVITCCKAAIRRGGRVWDQADDTTRLRALLAGFQDSAYMSKRYRDEFNLRHFADGLDELLIFGKLELFVTRINKMSILFNTVLTFRTLSEYSLEGFEPILQKFFTSFDDFRRKSGDPLDYTKPSFDKDYFDFSKRVEEIDASIQVYVNSNFESVENIMPALRLLQKFSVLLQRDALREDLRVKYLVLFQAYGTRLESVQRHYEHYKADPPLYRNAPPVAGRVLWARLLYHQIDQPMQVFLANGVVASHRRETSKIVRLYNRMSSALAEYEALWTLSWAKSLDALRCGIQSSVVVHDPKEIHKDRGYAVNFDPALLEVLRETRWLRRLGVTVPAQARELCGNGTLPINAERIRFLLGWYAEVATGIPALARPAMQSHIAAVERALHPGLDAITWGAVTFESYVTTLTSAIQTLATTVERLNDTLDNRVHAHLKSLMLETLVCVPDTPVSMAVFAETQFNWMNVKRDALVVKHEEIRSAVVDAARIIDPSWSPGCLTTLPGATPRHDRSGGTPASLLGQKRPNAHNTTQYLAVPSATSAAGGSGPIVASGGGGGSAASTGTPSASQVALSALYLYFNREVFKAVLRATTRSLSLLRQCVGGASTGAFLTNQQPVLEFSVELQGSSAVLQPSMDEVHDTINGIARAVLACSQRIGSWPHVKGAYSSQADGASFFDELSRNKELVRVVLILSGSMFALKKQADEFISGLGRFDFLWLRDKATTIKLFVASTPTLDAFETEMSSCHMLKSDIELVPESCFLGGAVLLRCHPLKASLLREIAEWARAYGAALYRRMDTQLADLQSSMETLYKRSVRPLSDDISHVKEDIDTLKAVAAFEWQADAALITVDESVDLLQRFKIPIPGDSLDRVSDLRSRWRRLRAVASEKSEAIGLVQHCYKRELIMGVNMYGVEIVAFRNDFDTNGPMVVGLKPMEAIERLRRFQRTLDDKIRRWQINVETEEAFGLAQHRYPELAKTRLEMAQLDRLYSLYLLATSSVKQFSEILWKDVKLKAVFEEAAHTLESVKRLPGAVKHWPAYLEMKRLLEDFLEMQPVLEQLAHRSVRERHWREVMKICGRTWSLDRDTFKLNDLLTAGLLPVKDDIVDLALASEKEGDIETRLNSVAAEWKSRELSFAEFKHRGFIILRGDETGALKEQLEEALVLLGSTMASRYIAPFRAEAHSWSVRLSTIGDVLTQWLEVQSLWMYLEAVFAGGDIMKQLPAEAKRFAMIDKQWVKIFFKATEVCNVVDFCFGNDMLKALPYLKDQLECCQRALSHYLEQKRNAFARFFFVSDSVLLEVLSQGSDPHAMQPHWCAIFDGIAQVVFDSAPNNKKQLRIKAMTSQEGECVPLSDTVGCEGNIEDWLQELCHEMQRTVRVTMREAVAESMSIRGNLTLIQKFLYAFPSQVVITTLQILWTIDVTRSLQSTKATDRKETSRGLLGMKELLADQIRLPLGPAHRTHIETLATMAVHNQEVWEQSVKKAKDASSFDWQKQLRFYWTDRDRCMLRIADADIQYCDEYLGIKERLVITPLTDRCYTTLSQALAMCMGGAPAGPAGTGKTETVKDLGRAAGKYVVVFNCSDQWDYRSLGKIFKGLAQSGSWGCFDEFNRITLPVLSVVAQQVSVLFSALKQHRVEFVWTDGSHCKLLNTVGVFVTMNPGYAGRQELPENLKILFRGMSMMVPDRQSIMRVKLAAAGYKQEDKLSRKFFVLYQMCEQQLSSQRHYDFGLRNILSVLRSAGDVLHRSASKDEEAVFMRTVRDMNLSKLVYDDVPVFLSLLSDLFPSRVADKASYPPLEAALRSHCAINHVSCTPAYVGKCLQIYETKLVRHGLMVVGPAGGGKSTCYAMLLKALSDTDRKHREVRMNPKAITAQQMFGTMDVSTGDWFDGVFSFLWRRYNKEKTTCVWLICDGPVDTLWVESLNTVLDDNKLLTLANGDRILMSPTLKMCFEVESLANASPATVSRAGIIYLSLEDVGWEPVFVSSIDRLVNAQTWSSAVGLAFRVLGQKYLLALHEFTSRQCKTVMLLTLQHLCAAVIRIARPLGEELSRTPGPLDSEVLCMVFWYAALWAYGGQLDLENRALLNAFAAPFIPRLGGSRRSPAATPPTKAVAAPQQAPHSPLVVVTAASASKKAGLGPEARRATTVLPPPGSRLAAHSTATTITTTAAPSGSPPSSAFVTVAAPLHSTHGSGDTNDGDIPEDSASLVSVFDHFISISTGRWVPWVSVVPQWHAPADFSTTPTANFGSLFIPTVESTVLSALLQTHYDQQAPCLFVGVSGCAKTVMLEQFLSSRPGCADTTTWKKMNVSRATKPHMLQGGIEDMCEKRMGSTFGPKRNKVMALFIDDLHMADTNEWGDQPTCELLRQLMEAGGVYALDKPGVWKKFVDLLYFVSITVPSTGSGGTLIPNRLRRHFTVLNVPMPAETALSSIYSTVLKARFARSVQLQSMVDRLVQAMLALWKATQQKLLPTPSRFHYSFNLRDLTRITQGMLMCPTDSMHEPLDLVRLLHHESARVLGDKLNQQEDVDWFTATVRKTIVGQWGTSLADLVCASGAAPAFANFTSDPIIDESGEVVEIPRLYLCAPLHVIQSRLHHGLLQHNEGKKGHKLDLVLFDAAVHHVLRISRVLATPRGSALLVGIGGSGKQSLTRLSAFVQGFPLFQPTINSHYNSTNFLEDLRGQYLCAGVQGPCVLLLTDNEIKQEDYLEYINCALASGEVPGLFSPDDKDSARNSVRSIAKSIAKREFEDSEDWLWNFFINRVRDNLHFAICFSPQGDKFRRRVRQFPGIIASCTISYCFPWPQEALLEVAMRMTAQLTELNADAALKAIIPTQAAAIHTQVEGLCSEYFLRFRQQTYTTPKLFLTFLQTFTKVYREKLASLSEGYDALVMGLRKLEQAREDVAAMSVSLAKKEELLRLAQRETEELLVIISAATADAEAQRKEIAVVKDVLQAEATKIADGRAAAEADLVAAQPALEAAKKALEQITPKDMQTLRVMQKPPEMVRRIFDGAGILLHNPLDPVTVDIGKGGKLLVVDSWITSGRQLCGRSDLLDMLLEFNRSGKDQINDETCELLQPVLSQEDFTYERAKTACGNVAGLCTWVRAMVTYRDVSKFVAPKILALTAAEGKLRVANAKLNTKKAELERAEEALNRELVKLNEAKAKKQQLEDDATSTRRRVNYASQLIGALSEERERWQQQHAEFKSTIRLLVGDALCCAAFVTYGGPFNTVFRSKLTEEVLLTTCVQYKVPHSPKFDIVAFMTNEQTVTRWQIQGLPMDTHSVENAIIMTVGSKTPFLIDPQDQGSKWLKQQHFYSPTGGGSGAAVAAGTLASPSGGGGAAAGTAATGAASARFASPSAGTAGGGPSSPSKATTGLAVAASSNNNTPANSGGNQSELIVATSTQKNFMTIVADALLDGKPLLLEDVAGLDPLLDSLAERRIVRSGRKLCVQVLGDAYDFDDRFRLFLCTKLPTLSYEPEVFAKVAVIDFSVTLVGLQEQLLGRVIQHDRNDLEVQKSKLVEDISSNQAKLRSIEEELLAKLSAVEGSLVDDETLILTLSYSKSSAQEIKAKLLHAGDTRRKIELARAEFSSVALRGAVLYFVAVEMSAVNACYQISLGQFISKLFDRGLRTAAILPVVKERVKSIIETVTRLFFVYVGRGLFEIHKPLFSLLMAAKVEIHDGKVTPDAFRVLLRGGAGLDIDKILAERAPPCKWIPPAVWKNCLALADVPRFRNMADIVLRNDQEYHRFYDSETPETALPKDIQEASAFEKLLVVRAMREDRTPNAALIYVKHVLGSSYGDVPPVDIDAVVDEVSGRVPVLFLLSTGSDPSSLLEGLAKRRRKPLSHISLGQGQEAAAKALLERAVGAGEWVVFQNCHLGVSFLQYLEHWSRTTTKDVTDCRIWLTSEPTPELPTALLQSCVKLTNEPPRGMLSAMTRACGWLTVDSYDLFRRAEWRPLVYSLCYLHATLLERRQYGHAGWQTLYQFNDGDFFASLSFLQSHFASIGDNERRGSPISWEALRFMVGDIQYGGRVTNSRDRLTLQTIVERVLHPRVADPAAVLCPELNRFPMPEPGMDLPGLRQRVQATFSVHEPPQVVGMHPNSEVAYRLRQATSMMATILAVQPRHGGGEAGATREDSVRATIDATSKRLPPVFTSTAIKEACQRLGVVRPLSIFFGLEAERLSTLLRHVMSTLSDLRLAIAGTIALTPQLSAVSDALFTMTVPEDFAALSWSSASFSSWMTNLLRRHEQIASFLLDGSRIGFSLTHLYNPTGFLNSVRQEICRRHASEGWVFDRVESRFEVLKKDITEIDSPPDEGVYVYGLFLEGGTWDRNKGRLRQAANKELFHSLPAVHAFAGTASTRGTGGGGGTSGAAEAGVGGGSLVAPAAPPGLPSATSDYRTRGVRDAEAPLRRIRLPCYLHPRRGDASIVCEIEFPHDETDPQLWILRGTAVLCTTE